MRLRGDLPCRKLFREFCSIHSEDKVPEEGLLGTWEAKDGRRLWLGQPIEIAVTSREKLAMTL